MCIICNTVHAFTFIINYKNALPIPKDCCHNLSSRIRISLQLDRMPLHGLLLRFRIIKMNPSFTILLSLGSTPQTLKIFATFISKLFLERYKYSIDTHIELIKPKWSWKLWKVLLRISWTLSTHFTFIQQFSLTPSPTFITIRCICTSLGLPWISLPSSDSLHPAN